jgi:ATP-binding cassette subfamily B protein
MAEQNQAPPIIHINPSGGTSKGGSAGMMAALAIQEKPKNLKTTINRLFRHVRKSRKLFFGLMACALIVTAADVSGPFFQQRAIDAISVHNGALAVDFNKMSMYLIVLLCIFACSSVLVYVQGVLAAKLSQATIYSLRQELFRKICKLPIQYSDNHSHGDIMSRMINDVENISNAVSQSITTLLSSTLTLVGALCLMIYYSPIMTLTAVLSIPLVIFMSSMFAKLMRKYYSRQQAVLGQLNGQIEEKITGFRTVVAYSKENDALQSFSAVSEDLRANSIKAKVWSSALGPIMNFLGNLQYVLLAVVGGWLMLFGAPGMMTVGTIQAMLQYSRKLSQLINMIANQYANILTALAGAERVFEMLDAQNEIDAGKIVFQPESGQGAISFQNVQFGYAAGKPVLKDFSLDVEPGQKIAIVGATGSGKTTIVNLLTRFYELNGGKITLDGIDATSITKASLRKSIAIVLQDTVLFHDTIRANIRFGRTDATDAEIRAAADTAMADRFISRLPDGYETILSEAGSNLSEGQRQLLAIARAVLSNPKILILDEATSSVDTRTEMRIQQAMVNLMKGRTSLIIAHRISTIRDADAIIVIANGTIIESGNHDELIAIGGEYHKLYSKQFAGIAT